MKLLPHELQYIALPYREAHDLAHKNRTEENWKEWVNVVGHGWPEGKFHLELACSEGLSLEERRFRNEAHYAVCPVCGDGRNWKMFHTIMVTESMGVSPMCEECFRASNPQQREQVTRALVGSWRAECGETECTKMEEQIVDAVASVGGWV